ncbi:jasmonoyl-L-amino acid 12-hydroxylase [Ranunculus cassubicifolius]
MIMILPYIGVFLLTCFTILIYVAALRKLSTRSSPPSYPFIGCLMAFYENRYRILDWYTDLLSESPTQTIVIKRFGAQRTVITANPENVEYMVKTNFGNFPKGKPFTVLLGDLLGSGIFNVDGEMWMTERKLVSHVFTTRSLKDFTENALEEEVRTRLLPVLERASETNQVIDMQEVLRTFAFNIVCKFSLGIDPASLDLSFISKAFDVAAMVSARRGAAPIQLLWKFKRFFGIGPEKELKENVSRIREAIRGIIKKKKIEMKANDKDLLSQMITKGYSDDFVIDMVISFIMAGKDTTSSAMTWVFWLLSGHSHIQNDLVQEVRNTGMDYNGLKEMQYMKASLCESMRLFPPVAWDSKHPLVADMLPDGTRVYPGDRVTYFPFGMGRMESLWGKDTLEFKPDRWFAEPDKEGGKLKEVSPYKFAVFQAGPRVCLGKEMAFLQMKYVVASILNRFELKPVSLSKPVFVPLLTAHMLGGLKVKVQPRSGR